MTHYIERKMTSSESQEIPTLTPPTKKNLVIKDKQYLFLELLWLFLVFIPCRLLLSIFRKLFPSPGKSLKGQVVIVTGAGRGLGQGLALSFAREGAKVAVVDINQASAIQTAEAIVESGGTAKPYFTNVGRVEEIHELQMSVVRDLGPVDILVNNAGIIYFDSIEKMSQDEVKSVIDINLLSNFWMVQEFFPKMKSRNSGHIVAIASMSAIAGLGNGTAYTASKSGVMGFMDALRKELIADPTNNIKTTTVLPYFINTSEHYVKHWDLRIPAMRIEHVADTIVTAVKNEQVVLSVPEIMYGVTNFMKLLPTDIQDKFYSIVYTRLIPPTEKNKDKEPIQNLIYELTKKRQQSNIK